MGCLTSFPLSCWVLIRTITALNDIKGLDACVFYIYIFRRRVCECEVVCESSSWIEMRLCVRCKLCWGLWPPRLPSCARDPHRDNHPKAASDNGRFDWPRTPCSHYMKSVFIPLYLRALSLSSSSLFSFLKSHFSGRLLPRFIFSLGKCNYEYWSLHGRDSFSHYEL